MCPKSGIGRKRNWDLDIIRTLVVNVPTHIFFIKLHTKKNVIVRNTKMILIEDYDQQTAELSNLDSFSILNVETRLLRNGPTRFLNFLF